MQAGIYEAEVPKVISVKSPPWRDFLGKYCNFYIIYKSWQYRISPDYIGRCQPALARRHRNIIMLCNDYRIYRYKHTLSKPGLGQGSGPG